MVTPENIKKVLVIQTTPYIGDMILITPLINGLKQIYTDALIDVVVGPQCRLLMENNLSINHIHTYDKKKKGILSLLKFTRTIKKEKYNLCLCPHSSFRSGLIPWLARIKHRIGFKRKNLHHYLLTKCIPHNATRLYISFEMEDVIALYRRHKTFKILNLLKILPLPLHEVKSDNKRCMYLSDNNNNVHQISMQTTLFPDNSNYQKVDSVLAIIPNTNQVILIAPGSLKFTKRWPIEYFCELSERLIDQGYCIVLTGSKAERNLCDIICKAIAEKHPSSQNSIQNVAGEFNLLDSAAMMARVQLVVCNDSGTLHMANAMQTPVFAFFGSTTQDIGYFPFGEKDYVFEVDLPCRPCNIHGGKECPESHHNCMKMISVDCAYEKIVEFMKGLSQ